MKEWQGRVDNEIVQYFFQLVRTNDYENIERKLNFLLYEIKQKYVKNIKNFILLYKLIGHTRDIISGKGEFKLSYMQIYIWYCHFPNLAFFAFKQFVLHENNIHPYGSWKDIKLFCNYIKKRTNNEDHPLILYSMNLMLNQLAFDHYCLLNNLTSIISLAGKWAPRQRSKHYWLFNKMAKCYYSNYFINVYDYYLAEKKAKTHFRKLLSALNNHLKTPQIFMCSNQWEKITKPSSLTLFKNRKGFLKNNKNFFNKEYFPAGKCSIEQLVKAALNSTTKEEDDIINKFWTNNSLINKKLINIIPILDTSIYSLENDLQPLYNAIGLGIRISEKTSPFTNRMLIYSDKPQWIVFKENQTFVKKVKYLYNFISPTNNNFNSAIQFLSGKIMKNGLSANDVTSLTFVVLSGKHHCNNVSLHSFVHEIFSKESMKVFGTEYLPPRFIFWNLSSGEEYPALDRSPNVAFLAGYNSSNINILSKKNYKFDVKTPYMFLEDILSCNRYDILAKRLLQLV